MEIKRGSARLALSIVRSSFVVVLSFSASNLTYAECSSDRSTSLFETAPVIFVGNLRMTDGGTYDFSVEESMKGIRLNTATLVNAGVEGAVGFRGIGKRYIVFADWFYGEQSATNRIGPAELRVIDCGYNMQELPFANDLVAQARAQRRGGREAVVHGTLIETSRDDLERWTTDATHPLAGITIHASAVDNSVQARTRTRDDGTFEFVQLPAGEYRLTADLPPAWRLLDLSVNVESVMVSVRGGSWSRRVLGAIPPTK